ncbi:MAG: HAMP domain-containing histidine kinase [Desulfuromonadales bacterium]|nr:HAMP domain-containing histidine kinase [Desulfuromonadales bacterium]
MRWFRSLINPLFVFIGIQLAWIIVVAGWLYWFLGSHRQLRALAEKYSPELLAGGPDWVILVEGLVLLVAILAGVYVIFLFWSRQAALMREQKLFISQVTHELKSPLASLQLHIETIRRHQPPPERMAGFLETMMGDAARLNGLIDNLLSASRVEQKNWALYPQQTDFSAFVERYFRSRQFTLPRAGKLTLEVEPGLHAMIDRDAMETVFRNLLENAILYSDGPPEITVRLYGKGERCLLDVADRGRGIDARDQRKIFKMFYRVRRKDENIRGSGLGLFIVRANIEQHGGQISVESAGAGKGTTFKIVLPRCQSTASGEDV